MKPLGKGEQFVLFIPFLLSYVELYKLNYCYNKKE